MTPPRAPRKRWIVLLVGALVAILVIAIAGTTLFVTNTLPPLRATWDFTNDIEEGRYNSAFAQQCDAVRDESTRAAFDRFANRVNRNTDSFSVNIFSVRRNGDHATVEFTAHKLHEDDIKVKLNLVHERGDWKPCGGRYGRIST